MLAVDSVSLTVRAGEKHALLGENGAGKSTFVKMIDGVLRPDSGSILLDGKKVPIASPADARRRGIGMVFQHFSSFDALTVAENLALSLPRMSMRAIRKAIRETSETYGLSLQPDRRVETLSAGEKQRVEIVRCLLQKPRLLILDEPTSVLTPQEAIGLFSTLDRLSENGTALIYISHRLDEVRALCDRATILRRGKVVATCDPAQETAAAMAEMMIGEMAPPLEKIDGYIGKARLEVIDLSAPARDGVALRKINFAVRRGEILGIAGIAGEGQSELFAALSGERRTPRNKAVLFDGKPIGTLGVTARRRLGMAFAPEQRLGHAAIADLSLTKNLELTRHSLRNASHRAHSSVTKAIRETYDVRGADGDPAAGMLSGGNLQKFVIGRELDRKPGVFVVAQPTWGIDAGAAMSIRNRLIELSRSGSSVVAISQDLDEIFQIADRVAVIHNGELSRVFVTGDMTPEKIGMLMMGLDHDDAVVETLPRLPKREPAPVSPAPRPEVSVPVAAKQPVVEVSPTLTTAAARVSPAPKPQSAVLKIETPAAVPAVPASAPPPAPPAAAPTHPVPPPPDRPIFSTGGSMSVPWTPPEHAVRVEQK